MKKHPFPRNNASNISVFGASRENLLRNVIMHKHQICNLFLFASLEKLLFHVIVHEICKFWCVLTKHAFPCNNASNFSVFGTSR